MRFLIIKIRFELVKKKYFLLQLIKCSKITKQLFITFAYELKYTAKKVTKSDY